ncbi:MAG: Polymorphic outer membrane protein [Candidatus Daviesbacteria bacterium GW2011_GWA2_38_24]|uniref:Polymorphic outer membrane protein n=1 Tax=Candidatus Daviesbacteria bacterium GW2011_GWA2_38_24 TaxID=1618422 RepID=A0A0G0MLI8_9BACT|nr:MAG: Polymorphic outer membrane protein [Candidatus Daviesbacteria bacterium GW2011_GWA2_38_24]KKQ78324.1 MAG: Polymorphic outer membrane protein [Candidatus Daviesbacteria bacterium GW2011_GWA1_38_7]OGE24155.1 MAG: hypothetical protein A2688_00925 [Candidatus Daviesbacteria bacterium RIFCSPHIGHO2_01_FULL_38_8]
MKAFFLSISILFILGLVFFLYSSKITKPQLEQRTPVTSKPTNYALEISTPSEEELVYDSSILVSGRTAPGSTLLIAANTGDFVAEANLSGDFSKIVNLSPGLNQITISSVDLSGNTQTVEKQVYYSKEKL